MVELNRWVKTRVVRVILRVVQCTTCQETRNDASCGASEVTGCQRAQGAPRLEVARRLQVLAQ